MNESTWRKSSYSGDWGDCVEVAGVPEGAAVRDSKAPEAGRVRVSDSGWRSFLSQVKAGQYDS